MTRRTLLTALASSALVPSSWLLAAALLQVASAQPSSPLPTPPPEMQRLAVWHGEWTYTGETATTPLGPGAKFHGTMKGGSILNGFATEHLYLEQGPAGTVEGREWCWFDASTGAYGYVYLGDGYIEQGRFTMDGTTCRWEAKGAQGGIPFSIRGTETCGPDRQSMARRAEISTDDKTWIPYLSMNLVRVPAAAADAAVEKELLALEHAWARAYVARDVKALERIEADGWICTTADGTLVTKAEDIRDVASGAFAATAFEMSDLKVHLHGDAAVVTGRQLEEATYKGSDASAIYRVTDTWVRRAGRWQAISTHVCKIGTP